MHLAKEVEYHPSSAEEGEVWWSILLKPTDALRVRGKKEGKKERIGPPCLLREYGCLFSFVFLVFRVFFFSFVLRGRSEESQVSSSKKRRLWKAVQEAGVGGEDLVAGQGQPEEGRKGESSPVWEKKENKWLLRRAASHACTRTEREGGHEERDR